MDPPPVRDDVLAQPTRARLFAMLAELKRATPTEELAQRLGLHPNGVRQHLERLRGAGLVTRTRTRQPVGRPRDEWSIAAGARPGGEPPQGYQDLGRWLSRAIAPTKKQLREIEATGREIGGELAPRPGAAPSAGVLETTLAALGFQPRCCHDGSTVTYRLGNCPYREAARENQAVICTLHRGITQGLVEALEPAARLADFVPRDPDEAGCTIEVRDLEVTRP